ncbi:MAG: hypothetical protein JSU67_03690 [Gammaproteobacteria bacterium]|nr:MAG: hypothetical protein JSU67_03690 [Gammaproteobacteria bacterium]
MSEESANLDERQFQLTRIEKTTAPAGEADQQWYEYVIGEGTSAIRGKRAGSRKSVKQYAEEFAENLNRRANLGYSPYAARTTRK